MVVVVSIRFDWQRCISSSYFVILVAVKYIFNKSIKKNCNFKFFTNILKFSHQKHDISFGFILTKIGFRWLETGHVTMIIRPWGQIIFPRHLSGHLFFFFLLLLRNFKRPKFGVHVNNNNNNNNRIKIDNRWREKETTSRNTWIYLSGGFIIRKKGGGMILGLIKWQVYIFTCVFLSQKRIFWFTQQQKQKPCELFD